MNTKSWYTIGAVCSIVAGIGLGMGLRGCTSCSKQPCEPITIHDTVSVHDTAYIAGKTRTLYVTRFDTLYVENATTDTLSDTCYVTVPIECKEYRDTFETDSTRTELAVRFSGYDAKIESVDLVQEWTMQPIVETRKQRFTWSVSFGLQGGYGATFGQNGVVEMRPYAGVGGTLGFSINF